MELVSHDVRARDGTRIRLWERSPPDPDDTVLFVHGATYGGRSVFDVNVDDRRISWLRAAARQGFAAFAVDIRGYGNSERPPELNERPEKNPPVVRASVAADDVAAAVDYIADDSIDLHLVSYSWGTIVCGTLLQRELNANVLSLTQFAPVYDPPSEFESRFAPDTPPPAYRTTTKDQIRQRWNDQLDDEPAASRGRSNDADPVLDAFWSVLSDSGQQLRTQATDSILAPNGTLVDMSRAAASGPLYSASTLEVPTLVVRGSSDMVSTRTDALSLYDDFTGARPHAYIELAGGTHFLHLEPRRDELHETVARFQNRRTRNT